MQPYLLTLIVVIVATFILRAKHIGVPKELALPFFREER